MQQPRDMAMISSSSAAAATASRRPIISPRFMASRNVAVVEKGWIGGGNAAATRRSSAPITARRQRALLRMVDEAVGGPGAGPQLQRDGQPARRAQPLSFGRAARCLRRGAAMRCGCTASMPNCWTASRCARWRRFLDFDNARFPIRAGCCSGAAARRGTTRWPGAMPAARPSGVDIIQNCEVTGFKRDARARSPASRPRAASSAPARSAWRWPAIPRASRHGRPAPADREPCAAGLRQRGAQAGVPVSSPSAPGISMSASPTRAAWCSAATSTATTAMPSAATCRVVEHVHARAAWRSCR
jgi:hypothetical protein